MDKEIATSHEGSTARLDPTVAARLLAAVGTAENLGFLMVAGPPAERHEYCPPDCDKAHEHVHASRGEGQSHDHAHDHEAGRGGGHEHGGNQEPHDDSTHDGGHEHMRVFPVFELDEEGQIVEVIDEEGKVTKEGGNLREAAGKREKSKGRQRKKTV